MIGGARGPSGRAVRQLSVGGPDSSAKVSDQEGISHSSYSPEELARKQRDKHAFSWLVGFLESGIVPQDSELILSDLKNSDTIWSGGSLKLIRRESSGELVLQTQKGSWFGLVYGRR